MIEMNEKIALKRLKDRIKLLTRGVIISQRKGGRPIRPLQAYYGGVGPQGRGFYLCYSEEEFPRTMIRIPIYPEDYYYAKYAIPTKRSEKNPHDFITEDGIILKGIPPLRSQGMLLSDGTPIDKVRLSIHCYNTYVAVIGWRCVYFGTGDQCKYCTIDIPLKKKKAPEKLTNEQIVEALKITCIYDSVRSIALSTGTYPNSDNVTKQYIALLKKIRKITDLTVRVEIDPVEDLSLIKELAKFANAIGIFLEFSEEKLRKKICPGKARISKTQYVKNWKEAVKYFGGSGQVVTHSMVGFGENYDSELKHIEECARIGVRSNIEIVQVGSKALGKNFVPSFIGKEDELVDFHIKAAQIMHKHGIYIKYGDTGCLGCLACTSMMEASQYIHLAGLV